MSKILVVDDEIGIREMLSDILSDEGHTVYAAENAESARVFVSQGTFDVILLDIWMSDTDGISLLKEWGARKLLKCPVIMMSGHGTIETAVEAIRYGALSFLEKPITMQKLLEAVKYALEKNAQKASESQPAPRPSAPPQPAPVPLPGRPNNTLPVIAIPNTDIELDFKRPLREVRDELEKAYLLCLMAHESCQMTRVAKHAGLERTHLYRKIKMLNIAIPRNTVITKHNPDTVAQYNDDSLKDLDSF